ncbi:MAG: MerR family transcriptional regulator [Candidatus Omnitrophica bacterium]|nr:MerR family transcriptional regulator [Candidatus Omnitrophota bacterium]
MKAEKYYSANEVARFLGISKQTLVRYEQKKVFPRAGRNKVNSWREYTIKDVNHLRKLLGRSG